MTYNFSEGEILLFNKPLTWTSFDLVRKVKGCISEHLKIKVKVGHAGTLDPLATGLLILCTGKKTKVISEIQNSSKAYEGIMKIGESTPSFDGETKVDFTKDFKDITREEILETVAKLTGYIQQKPPIYSALRVGGKRMYEFARAGKEIEISTREVEIQKFEIISVDMPYINFRVECSKGTYIRSLVNDFGRLLNNYAWLTQLCRTRIGNYILTDAMSIEEFDSQLKLILSNSHESI